ncbi:MAG: hypothetical protein Q7S40_27405 [Opitutaceae bacterium]|nr:hypothetical protein [Opitutaceae bacterium]
MELRKPFDALQHFLADANAVQSVKPVPPLNIPPNTPQQLIQQILQQIAAQALNKAAIEVPFFLVAALIESSRLASEHRSDGKVTAWRNLNNEIGLSCVTSSSRWQSVPIMQP